MAVIMIGLSSLAYSVGAEQRVAFNDDWGGALDYLRTSTPADSVVMSWWDYGYWILDVGQRKPVVDGGLYNHDTVRDSKIGEVYCTTDASRAVEIMREYGAQYVVFSTVDKEIITVIAGDGLGSTGASTWLAGGYVNSLWWRSLNGGFQSEAGLKLVYASPEGASPAVAVLGLESSG
ncbi:MAG: hypothetical protein NTU41_00500 [Chloroflexi bacterium]|nr:hypothetical protein [Chloroflexota bacterium]